MAKQVNRVQKINHSVKNGKNRCADMQILNVRMKQLKIVY